MVEAEVAFAADLAEVLSLLEDLVKHSAATIVEHSLADVELYSKLSMGGLSNLELVHRLLDKPFAVLTYEEALKVLHRSGDLFSTTSKLGASLSRQHELYLAEKHCGGQPVFVTRWPKKTKPFYVAPCNDNDCWVDAVDLLLPKVGEVAGGSLREHRGNHLMTRIKECGLKAEALEWYVNLRRSGSSPTGGFGLGFDRLVQFLLGVENIRDAVPFARTTRQCLL